jgi:uncharacterized membrane protein YdcZ (DUF606 family)
MGQIGQTIALVCIGALGTLFWIAAGLVLTGLVVDQFRTAPLIAPLPMASLFVILVALALLSRWLVRRLQPSD